MPKPMGFFEAGKVEKINDIEIRFTKPSFVRAFIEGRTLYDLPPSNTRDYLFKIMYGEIRQVMTLGYDCFAGDINTGQNAIATPSMDQVFLIDFGNLHKD